MSSATIALAGSPNCGKTALFNALTGGHQKVANYPGVTVEHKEGFVTTASGMKVSILDLPGTYSLTPRSADEQVTLDVLLHRQTSAPKPDVIVCVADATNLERSLNLVLELRAIGKPVVFALNMMDLAKKRGLELDLVALEKEILIPVIPTVAVRKEGIPELLAQVEKSIAAHAPDKPLTYREASPADIRARYQEVDRILRKVTRASKSPATMTQKIDRIALHPVFAPLILVLMLAIVFQAVFSWAEPFMGLIETGTELLGAAVSTLLGPGWVRDLIVDGMIAGVGSVVVFLPQIIFLFFFILLLEDTGYMARAAFIMDRIMRTSGLHGRAFIPLLSSYACAIPGIMAARTIDNPRDRLATIFIAPLMTCSARLPVYSLLIAAFIPNTHVWGFFRLQGLVMLGLYTLSIPSALLIAFVLKKTALKGPDASFLLELPTYKMPNWRNLFFGLRSRVKVFLARAGKLILFASVLIWILSSFPKVDSDSAVSQVRQSYAGQIGSAIQPVLAPLGFDWRIATGLIPGFAAREVMVGALGTVFAVEANSEEELEQSLSTRLSSAWTLPTALSLLIWYVFSPQCLATFAVVRRETASWKWTAIMFMTLLLMAYLAALVTYQISSVLL